MVTAFPVALPDNEAGRLSALFDAHHDRLYKLARRLAPSIDDALDLVQDTFVKAAKSITSVPIGLKSEEAWLVRVLINIRRDQWRQAARRTRHDQTLGYEPVVDRGPEAAVVARATVWRALDILAPRRRAIIVMHELEGQTIPAIAALLGISAITVRWHLSRGRDELGRALRPHTGRDR